MLILGESSAFGIYVSVTSDRNLSQCYNVTIIIGDKVNSSMVVHSNTGTATLHNVFIVQ